MNAETKHESAGHHKLQCGDAKMSKTRLLHEMYRGMMLLDGDTKSPRVVELEGGGHSWQANSLRVPTHHFLVWVSWVLEYTDILYRESHLDQRS